MADVSRLKAKDVKRLEWRVQELVDDMLGPGPEEDGEVRLEHRLREDLGMDSLDHVELSMWIEEEFGIAIPDEEAEPWQTVQDIVDTVKRADQAGGGW